MSSLVAGIDLSTKRLHAALVDFDTDQAVYRDAIIGGDLRYIRRAVVDLLADVWTPAPDTYPAVRADVVSVAVEYPAGKFVSACVPVFGAVVASIPSRIHGYTNYRPSDWRRRLALLAHPEHHQHKTVPRSLLAKGACHELVRRIWTGRMPDNEHHLDALGIALVWRAEQHAAAAA